MSELIQLRKKTDDVSSRHQELTQKFSTWGDKLLQHTDVLSKIQNHGVFHPITIQLSPTEACDSDCDFCSVAARPIRSKMSWETIRKTLMQFSALGAKSVEITGGGNPMLYKDSGKTINDIIRLASAVGLQVGIITNSESLKRLDPNVYDMISWIRISLIKLDEGCNPEDYDFCGFPYEKLGFSYILYGPSASTPIKKKAVPGTTIETIEKISKLVDLHGGKIKFVRFAGNCLVKGNNALAKKSFQEIIDENDHYKKFFIKDIDSDDDAYDHGCYVGAIRPYVAADPDGDGSWVYTCTSHVLNKRTYDRAYALCRPDDIINKWDEMSKNYRETGYPYDVNGNCGKGWSDTCKFCYYKFNNRLLHTVAQPMPDKDFA